MAEILEQQVVLFIDLLGFSETTYRTDTALQAKVLALLTSLASLKSDFVSSSIELEGGGGTSHHITPSVSTFSDNIVASYSLSKMKEDDRTKAFIVLAHLSQLVGGLAIAALSIGFLIRGGVTIGKLYHSGGVVFGEALIEAVGLEGRTAIYPRVVISEQAMQFFGPSKNFGTARDLDSLYYVDYYRDCVLKAALPGHTFVADTRQWMSSLAGLLRKSLEELDGFKHTNQRAKWAYFIGKLREASSRLSSRNKERVGH